MRIPSQRHPQSPWHLCKMNWRWRSCEEQAKQEVERLHQECTDLRWRRSEDAGSRSRREMQLPNHIQMLTRQLRADPSADTVDPYFQMFLQPATQTGSCYSSCRTTSYPASMLQLPLTPSPLSVSSARVVITLAAPALRRNPNYPPHILITGSPQLPRSIPGSLSPFTQQAFPIAHSQHQALQRGQEVPFHASHPNRDYANHSSAFYLFYPGGRMGLHLQDRDTPCPLRLPSVWGGGVEGAELPDRMRRRGRTHTHTATQLDRHDAEGNGIGNSNAGRDVSKADNEAKKDPVNLNINDDQEETQESKSGRLPPPMLGPMMKTYHCRRQTPTPSFQCCCDTVLTATFYTIRRAAQRGAGREHPACRPSRHTKLSRSRPAQGCFVDHISVLRVFSRC
ncbi:hypothetical protein FIBSPDRAFT_277804 [Athelia psychrophila]|uniref:Uncharacterized protein n=1 Tax=Athelia psychrophila TaxID=1759441 RepID=A0A165WQ57_9AGAM|nr:hypothetical protein FIBSPDRAFT_277804 [Fibularhizoctonia sp. CBS 109695]